MATQLQINAGEVLAAAEQGNDAGMALAQGRLVASIKSQKTGEHITVQARCRRKAGENWTPCDFAEATHVFLEVPGTGGPHRRNDKIGTYYPAGSDGRWAGAFFADRAADPARVWAAIFALQFAAGREVSDQAEFILGRHCLACGRELTHPDSIRRNLGPDCAAKGYRGDHQRKHAPGDVSRPLPGEPAPRRPDPTPGDAEARRSPEDASDAATEAHIEQVGLFVMAPGRSASDMLRDLS